VSGAAIGAARRLRGPESETVLAGGVAQLGILVSGVLAARMLGVENRGHLALFWVIGLIPLQLGMLGLPLAATYWIARSPLDARRLLAVLRVPALWQIALVPLVVVTLMLALFADDGGSLLAAGLIFAIAIPLVIAQQYALAVLLGLRNYRQFNLYRLLPVGLYALALIPLFALGVHSLVAVTLCWTGAAAIGSVAVVVATLALLADGDERHAAPIPSYGEMTRFGLKALLGSNSPSDTFQLDQAAVGLFISPAALGLYVVGVAFTNLPRLISSNLGLVASPEVTAEPDPKRAWAAVWKFGALTLLLCGLAVGALELAAGWLVPLLFGDSFSGATTLTRILLVAALLAAVRRVLSDAIRGVGHPGAGALAEIIALVTLLVGIVLFAGDSAEAIAKVTVAAASAGLVAITFAALWLRRRTGTATD
jgi:O-antigen/teichoic acid export membrane protein